MFIFQPIFDFFWMLLWNILVAFPFTILKYIDEAIRFIGTGLTKVLLFGTDGSFSPNNLPALFYNFIIISIILFFLFFFGMIVRSLFISFDKKNESLKMALKYSIFSLIIIWIIPISIYLMYSLVETLLHLVSYGGNVNIAQMLFLAMRPEGVSLELWQNITDNNFLFTSELVSVMGNGNFALTMILSSVMGIGVFLGYLLAALTVLQKTFDQIFLFIISPFIAPTMMIDGGARMKSWKDQMIAKSLTIFSIVVGSQIFAWVVGFAVANVGIITNSNDRMLNSIFILLVGIGGALALVEFGNLIASFVGEGVGLKESAANTRSLIKGLAVSTIPIKKIGGAGTMAGKFMSKNKGESNYRRDMKAGMNAGQSKTESKFYAFQAKNASRTDMNNRGYSKTRQFFATRSGGFANSFNKASATKDNFNAGRTSKKESMAQGFDKKQTKQKKMYDQKEKSENSFKYHSAEEIRKSDLTKKAHEEKILKAKQERQKNRENKRNNKESQ